MMIVVAIKGPSIQEAKMQIAKAVTLRADLVELRLDLLDPWNVDDLKDIRGSFPIPMIFKVKKDLPEVMPEYIDSEYGLKLPEETRLILSHHNFEETPDLETLYEEMKKTPADFYKIAVTPKNTIDALRILLFSKSKKDVIAIGMGPYGEMTRILASPFTYASLDDSQKTAPGQLAIQAMLQKYRCHTINQETLLYGLIGDPVDKSISDETHNCFMESMGINAVYLKMQVTVSELPEFLSLAKKMFSGLSVTMPLKEAILPFLDEIDSEAERIGAVNTILIQEGKLFGFNTDGKGALNAIEKELSVSGKHVVILGAGGAAKAIGFESMNRGAIVTIINRDAAKAGEVARRFSCISSHSMPNAYDILINCTPAFPIAEHDILKSAIVMDITTKPKDTPFLMAAKSKGCQIIYGYKMFLEQANYQFKYWFT